MPTIHLIANAHLDPVWLWDGREGRNEGIATCRTVLDLMDEFPDLTFIRGEAAIYRHIEEFDGETFARIRAQVDAGRWDIVGGTWVQPDTNMPSAATLLRHFERGRGYFESRFGASPRIAWAADSFGHSAGLPSILCAAGMTGFAFTRPGAAQLTLPSPAFWWEGADGARILCYRPPLAWYGCERGEMAARLDSAVQTAAEHNLEHVACFYGLGNHGGGPTRRLLHDLQAWRAAHPDITVVHSGLHRFFGELEAQNAVAEWPTFRGELGYCLRGCYSAALRIKTAYRALESDLARTETLAALTGVAGTEPAGTALTEVADAVLFNSFHDILPGSSTERALDEQLDEMGGARHACREVGLRALNALAGRIDTTVPAVDGDFPAAVPFLVWNPHPQAFTGFVEVEGCVDSRPVFAYGDRSGELPLEVRGPDGEPVPFQRIRTESDFFRAIPWRVRVLIPVTLPPLGWGVYTLGYVEGGVAAGASAPNESSIAVAIQNERFRVEAAPGGQGIGIFRDGAPLLGSGGLLLETLEDEWGSWGGLGEEPDSLLPGALRHRWRIEQTRTLEDGPLRKVLWTRLSNLSAGGHSWMDLTFSLLQGSDTVQVAARLRWNERAARLKMVLPLPGAPEDLHADFEVPGAVVARGEGGEVPGGRWVRVGEARAGGANAAGLDAGFGFASDAPYSFELREGALRATVVRATRYAADAPMGGVDEPWRPTLDAGELKFNFLLAGVDAPLDQRARELETAPLAQMVAPSPGVGGRSGSLGSLSPDTVRVLSLCAEGEGLLLRVQNVGDAACAPVWEAGGEKVVLPVLRPFEIGMWRSPQR